MALYGEHARKHFARDVTVSKKRFRKRGPEHRVFWAKCAQSQFRTSFTLVANASSLTHLRPQQA
eukprot:1384881-Amphidinium_carterae.1